jgi:hypothetical protein
MEAISNNILPCPLRLELLASLERLLCYCHTGNTAVLATSLMDPLGLSRGVLTDGFPILLKGFEQPSISLAMEHKFKMSPSAWPLKNGYPAVASKRAQILTYSESQFLVSGYNNIGPRIDYNPIRGPE